MTMIPPFLHYCCPACERKLKTLASAVGKQTHCPHCGHCFRIPGLSMETTRQPQRLIQADRASERNVTQGSNPPSTTQLDTGTTPRKEADPQPLTESPKEYTLKELKALLPKVPSA